MRWSRCASAAARALPAFSSACNGAYCSCAREQLVMQRRDGLGHFLPAFTAQRELVDEARDHTDERHGDAVMQDALAPKRKDRRKVRDLDIAAQLGVVLEVEPLEAHRGALRGERIERCAK